MSAMQPRTRWWIISVAMAVCLRLALLLGLLVGAAEVLPYIGFLIAAIAIVIAGATVSPFQALLGLAVYAGLNWTIGSFVTPRVMSRYLKMHAFVVTVSVLAGAQLLGAAGAVFATRLVSSFLFGVTALDAGAFLGAAAILTAVAFVAAYVPARRATRVDPLLALRAQ